MEFEGKQFEVFKWILVGIAIFMVYKLLNKFGLLGMTDAEKGAAALSRDETMIGNMTKDNPLVQAAARKIGKAHPSAKELGSILSSGKQYAEYSQALIDAHGFANDDEDVVYDVFRKLHSQYDINTFAVVFKGLKKKDLFGYLDSFLDEKELSKVHDIIISKPLA